MTDVLLFMQVSIFITFDYFSLALYVTFCYIAIMYSIEIRDKALRYLRKIPAKEQRRILQKIRRLANAPYALNNNVKALKGDNKFRLRVGDWRVLYTVDDNILRIEVIKIGPRGEVYQ